MLSFRFFLCALLMPSAAVFAGMRVAEGEIEGAKFAVALPVHWHGGLLLIAPGQRPESAPLVASLPTESPAYQALVNEGWMIATTSYRRGGIIIADAITDLDNLRAHLVRTYGRPSRVLLEGEAMGGYIVTLMAERPTGDTPLYQGAVAVGAALGTRELSTGIGTTFGTQIPLIFLASRSEFAAAKSYVKPPMPLPPELRAVQPALFRVERDGYGNINRAERLIALRALTEWITVGPHTLPKPASDAEYPDATREPTPGPSQVVVAADLRSFTARVTEIAPLQGNVVINAQPSDFAQIGIGKNAFFRLTIQGRDRRVIYGKDTSSAKRGAWVAFATAEGFTWLARHSENLAATAQLHVGDEVVVSTYAAEESPPADDSR